MSRSFYMAGMVVSLVVTGASGFYLYRSLNESQTVEVPLNTVPEEIQKPPAEQIDPNSPVTESVMPPEENQETKNEMAMKTEKSEVPSESKAKAPTATNESQLRNILFTFHSINANEVYLVGDFNEWIRKPLTRKNKKTWTVAQKIKPGTFEYRFIVDGKRIIDPNNSRQSENGNSIITVKPLKPSE